MGKRDKSLSPSSEIRVDPRAENLRSLARLLDSAFKIPGTGVRIGADSILGLIPVVGDLTGAALSGYIVLASARLGAPASTLVRMVINIGIDTVVGAVPVLGDMFDAGWRANVRNVELLDQHISLPVESKRANRATVIGVVVALLLMAAGAIALGIFVLRFLARLAT
ncbi:MAG TPA: DUF4112 domain-containing protein [Gemmatimonadaceae bacterium]|nr:DUF4112 domain-containing protein [Gemmatimonadaceae bacterium]